MNRKTKLALLLCIIGMSIGFAAVSTVLYLTGNTNVASNTGDFDVYFSKAVENGTENASIIKDKTHIAFTTELTGLNDKYVLNYDVTNASKQYDANLVMNCVGGNEYLRVENRFNTTEILPARMTRSGVLILTVIKATTEETSVNISCEISGEAAERNEVGGDTIEMEKDYLVIAEGDEAGTPELEDPYLGCTLNREYVETINIMASKEVPEGATLLGDVSNSQNGSIVMYSKDENHNNMLELYIGQDGGVVANPNSKNLFSSFVNVKEINGLENLDTSNVTNMNSMFKLCWWNLKKLDLSKWDTSKVTSMHEMFFMCERLETLDLSNWNTRNVTNMERMFWYCGNLKTTITIRGTKCTSYSGIFKNAGQITVNYTKDASDLVDRMIASEGRATKGQVVLDYRVIIKDEKKIDVTYNGDIVTLSPKASYFTIVSFKLNGNLIEGNTFTMPNEDAIISDVVYDPPPTSEV